MKNKNKAHDIIWIQDDGTVFKKEEFQRVIFIGENKIQKRIKVKKIILPIVFMGFLTSIVLSGFEIYAWGQDGEKVKDITEEYVEIADIVEEESVKEETIVVKPQKEENKKPTGSVINNSYYWKFDNVKLMNVNFNKLKKINKEVVAWLKVPGTNINYPVTHTDNNTFYLDHTFDKSKNSVGWIFLDYRNNGDLTNRNNVIYGHGRLDNIMFGTLENVLEKSWFKDESNRVIKTSTPTHNDIWEVFSVYVIEAESYYLQTGFVDDLDFYNFIKTVQERSKFDFETTVSTTDKLLTLSTCYSEKKRIVLHARLLVTEDKQTGEKYNVDAFEVIDKPLTITPGEDDTPPEEIIENETIISPETPGEDIPPVENTPIEEIKPEETPNEEIKNEESSKENNEQEKTSE